MNRFLFFIFLINILYSNDISIHDDWNKLLHIRDSKSTIISSEFFLSKDKNPTSDKELRTMIKLLNSNIGKEVACSYPARYTLLKKYNLKIPNYDLESCTQLNNFLDTFQKDSVSLVFTSEFINAPSSAFGHIMLIFKDDNRSFEVADTVHYAAQTPSTDSFFTYSRKGLQGGYSGYFIKEAFFKKIYEYNTVEQRYMYIFKLNFSKQEIVFLLYHLFELRKAQFKYYFLDENCASQTIDLLNIITGKKRSQNIMYYLPIDGLRDYKDNIIKKDKFIPLINNLDLLLNIMTKNQMAEFKHIIQDNLSPEESIDNIVKESLVDYTQFYFRKFNRSFRNYEDIMSLNYQKLKVNDNTLDPLDKNYPSHVGFGYSLEDSKKYFNISYRPVLIDIFDIQNNRMQESEISLLDFELYISQNLIQLNKLNFVNIKSYSMQLDFYTPVSWSFYSGLNKNNFLNKIKFNNEIGIGRSIKFLNILNLSFLLQIGFDNLDIYIKPHVYLYKNFDKYKFGVISEYKQYINEKYYNNTIFSSFKFDNLTYSLKCDINSNDIVYGFNMKYNF